MTGNIGIGKIYSSESGKKYSGKIGFELGDTFSGKIIDKNSDSNEITVRTLDGWQFTAEIEDGAKNLPDNLVKLQVVGFEDGKLKLKMVSNSEEDTSEDEVFSKILSENGLSSSDEHILKDMLSRGITLNRENISKVKTLLDFIDKLKDEGSNEGNNFILKYMNSKGIDAESPEGKQISEILTKFFDALETLSDKDILSMIENGIDINTENVESFKAIVKDESGISKSIKNLAEILPRNSFTSSEEEAFKGVPLTKDSLVEASMDKKIINEVNQGEDKQNVEPQLKTFMDKVSSQSIKENSANLKQVIIDVLKESSIPESHLKNIADQLGQKDNSEIFKKLVEAVEQNTSAKGIVNYEKAEGSIKAILEDTIGNHIELSREDVTEILGKMINNTRTSTNNKVSLINNLNKLIQKVNQEENLKASGEVKNLLENLRSSDSIKNNKANALTLFKISERINNTENTSKNELINLLNELKKNISEENLSSGKQQIVNKINKGSLLKGNDVMVELKESLTAIKQVVKDIISSSSSKNEIQFNNLIGDLKQNINNIKVYNNISEQYYYMDMPMKFYDKDYPCKLVIKDDRKSGKKLDSTNMKIALSIATQNLGSVDSYITVREKKMQVEIQCLEKWKKIFEATKVKLESKINISGYDISIRISKKEEEFNLVNCREFFNDGSLNKINVVV